MNNPIINTKNNFLIYSTIWVVISLVQIIILNQILQLPLDYSITDSIAYNVIFYSIGISLWYPTKFMNFERNKFSKIILNHSIVALLTSILWTYVGYYLLIYVIKISGNEIIFLEKSLLYRFIIGILFYLIIVLVYYSNIYYDNFKKNIIKEYELQNLIKESELKTLKYQINPHFIFNSLNSISSLTYSEPTKAREMIIKLSDYLRSTLSTNEKQKRDLQTELNNIKLYLEIEKIRFPDKLEIFENIDSKYLNIEIPSMILQPLIENAIKHGVYESDEKVVIKISTSAENEYLKIIIENNFDNNALPKKGKGIGLQNIKNRLSLMYKQDNLLKIAKTNSLYTAIIFIPLESN
ncbi:MAG: histidine kinase [Ignavibacteriales bacterium]|nr:histidine kinase [Ignavibacteriales bacterium]